MRIFAYLCIASAFHSNISFKVPLSYNRFSTRLLKTTVSPTETVLPATYESDLYRVLGVSRDSPRGEIKDAYLKIVFQNHPDRNKTEEALHIFRNATYAYQILGKDERSRAQYDRRISVQAYAEALEGFGNDVIVPLATEVAVPLLNFTVQSIGSFAIPFIRDAFEKSFAVVNAAINAREEDMFEDIVANAINAYQRTEFDQKIRNLRNQIIRFVKSLNESTVNYAITESALKAAELKKEALTQQLQDEIDLQTQLKDDAARLQQELEVTRNTEMSYAELYESAKASRQRVEGISVNLEASVFSLEGEVARLEEELREARERMTAARALLAAARAEADDITEATLRRFSNDRVETENAYVSSALAATTAGGRVSATKRELEAVSETLRREGEYRQHLAKKIGLVNLKREAAEEELTVLEKSREQSIAQNLARTGKILPDSREEDDHPLD